MLYRNKGDGTFEDVTAKAGVDVPGWSIGAAWLDYDRDGCVDLFIGRYVKFDPDVSLLLRRRQLSGAARLCAARPTCCFTTTATAHSPMSAKKSGIGGVKGRAMGVTAADFDLDGYPDIYVANDKTENFLFHNRRDGTFEEIAVPAGVAYGQNGENTSAMGPVFAGLRSRRPRRPVGLRLEVQPPDEEHRSAAVRGRHASSAGISQLAAQYVSWGTGVHDFDNDGLRRHLHRPRRPGPPGSAGALGVPQPWRRQIRGRFARRRAILRRQERGPRRRLRRLRQRRQDRCLHREPRAPGLLLHNTSPAAGHWIAVRLVGRKSNRDGIGAQVEVVAGGRRQQHERVAGSGYLSQDDPRVHFGLGAAAKIDRLTVAWPSGIRQVLENPPVDRVITIEEQ